MSRRNLLVAAVLLSLASAGVSDSADAQVPPGFASRPTFNAAGLANVVFMGGTVDQLEMAAAIAGANGVWAQDSSGGFQVLVVRGPAFLKDAFKAKQPGSLGPTAVTLTAGPPATTLRALADRTGFLIGNVIKFPGDRTNDPSNLTLAREFNYVTTFPGMPNLMTARGTFNARVFGFKDAEVAFAKQHGLKMLVTPLVWDTLWGLPQPAGLDGTVDTPAWLKFNQPDCGGWSPAELDQIMKECIQTFVSRYKGSGHSYVVVNEPFKRSREAGGGTQPLRAHELRPGPYTPADLKDSCWRRILGEDFIAKAFAYAHEADPGAVLIMNDSFTSGMRGYDRIMQDKFMELTRRLKAQGMPIHAVGTQMHLDASPNRGGPGLPPTYLDDFRDLLKKAQEIGVQVQVTEMDIYLPPGMFPDPAQKLKEVYKGVLSTCLQFANCTALTVFGISDRVGHNEVLAFHPDAAAVLFDANYRPKPAYTGVMEALRRE